VINSEAPAAGASTSHGRLAPPELLETRKGELPNMAPPPMPREHHPTAPNGPHATPSGGVQQLHMAATALPPPQQLAPSYPMAQAPYQQQLKPTAPGSNKIIWWIIALLALGAAAGAVLALAMK
jgi:hypothetical protein